MTESANACPVCEGKSHLWEGAFISVYYQNPETPPLQARLDPFAPSLNFRIKDPGVLEKIIVEHADNTPPHIQHGAWNVTTNEMFHLHFVNACTGCDGRKTYIAYARKKFLAGAPSADTDPR